MSLRLGNGASLSLEDLLGTGKTVVATKGRRPRETGSASRSNAKVAARALTQASREEKKLTAAQARAAARRKENLIKTRKHNAKGKFKMLNMDEVDEIHARAEREGKSVIVYNSMANNGIPYTYTPEGVDPEDLDNYLSDPDNDPTYDMTDPEYDRYLHEVWKAKKRRGDIVGEWKEGEGEQPIDPAKLSVPKGQARDESGLRIADKRPPSPAPVEESEDEPSPSPEKAPPSGSRLQKTGTTRDEKGPASGSVEEENDPSVEAQKEQSPTPLKEKRPAVPGGSSSLRRARNKVESEAAPPARNPYSVLFGL